MQLNFTPFPTITTERLVLRKLDKTDAAQLSILRSHEAVNKYIDRPKQTSSDEAAAFIEKTLEKIASNELMYWAVAQKTNDALIGTVCLWNFVLEQELAELGYELHPAFQENGFVTEAAAAVIDWAFNSVGLQVIVALLMEENTKSANVLLKNNFQLANNYTEASLRGNDGLVVYYLKRDYHLQLKN